MRLPRLAALLAACLGSLALAVPSASATFHLMLVREVYPGTALSPTSEFVELQMWAPDQNLVAGEGKILHVYGPSGAEAAQAKFPADVRGSANQSTLVLATPEADAQFGITPDAELPPGSIDPAGGKVCWVNIDCVSWGAFAGSATTPSPSGSPFSPGGIPDGLAIRRTIEPNCPTLLEPADDTQDSATDFFLAAPSPRPNSVAPSERVCGSAAPAGDGRPPQTTLTRKPRRRGADPTPTFRFISSGPDSSFQCRVDRGRLVPCASPYTTRRLRPGRHVFAVAARDAEGDLDSSPARFSFQIERRRR